MPAAPHIGAISLGDGISGGWVKGAMATPRNFFRNTYSKSIHKILHDFIQKLTFQYKKIARILGGSTPWTPFLEFLPYLLDSMATVFSIFVSVLKQNSSPNTKKSLGGASPPTPSPPFGPLLGLRPRTPRTPPHY